MGLYALRDTEFWGALWQGKMFALEGPVHPAPIAGTPGLLGAGAPVSWAYDLLLNALHETWGVQALIWWRFGVVAAAAFLVWGWLRRSGMRGLSALFLAAWVPGLTLYPAGMRPDLPAFLCLLLLLLLLETPVPFRWQMVFTGVIFLGWGNLHGSKVLGWLVLALHLADPPEHSGSMEDQKKKAALLALALVAGSLNPFPMASLVQVPPLSPRDWLQWPSLGLMGVFGVTVIIFLWSRTWSLRSAGCLILSLGMAVCWEQEALLAGALLLPVVWCGVRRIEDLPARRLRLTRLALLLGIASWLMVHTAGEVPALSPWRAGCDPFNLPVGTVQFLEENHLGGWGAVAPELVPYTLYHTAPALRWHHFEDWQALSTLTPPPSVLLAGKFPSIWKEVPDGFDQNWVLTGYDTASTLFLRRSFFAESALSRNGIFGVPLGAHPGLGEKERLTRALTALKGSFWRKAPAISLLTAELEADLALLDHNTSLTHAALEPFLSANRLLPPAFYFRKGEAYHQEGYGPETRMFVLPGLALEPWRREWLPRLPATYMYQEDWVRRAWIRVNLLLSGEQAVPMPPRKS